MQVSRLRQEGALGFTGREEKEAGGELDKFGRGVGLTDVGIAAIGALQRNLLGKDGTFDGELVGANVRVERDGVVAVSAGVDFATSNNPSI